MERLAPLLGRVHLLLAENPQVIPAFRPQNQPHTHKQTPKWQ